MIASRCSLRSLVDAAAEIGVTLDTTSLSATRHRVKLYPDTPQALYRPVCKWHREIAIPPQTTCRCRRWPDERGDTRYQRISASMYGNGRRVHAVCWHGFRDFFRAVYRREAGARFATAYDTWRDHDDFEARFRESGHRNIGSQMCPMAAAEACRCPESGSVGFMTEWRTCLACGNARPQGQGSDYCGACLTADQRPTLPDPVSLTTADMGTDDVLVQPDGITIERWADYNRKMNDLLMGRTA